MLEAPREDHVTVEPPLSRRDLRERHADLERDARLLGQDDDGAEGAHGGHDVLVQLADDRQPADEMVLEVVQPARVRLVAIREHAVALRAAPERVAGDVSVRGRSWHPSVRVEPFIR